MGHRIAQAVDFVARHPNCAGIAVARAVGPHGSTRYGYRTLHRAIRAGLIQARKVAGRYTLTVA